VSSGIKSNPPVGLTVPQPHGSAGGRSCQRRRGRSVLFQSLFLMSTAKSSGSLGMASLSARSQTGHGSLGAPQQHDPGAVLTRSIRWASQTQRVLAQRPQNFIAFARNKRPRAGGCLGAAQPPWRGCLPASGVWALNVGSTGSESANRGFVPGQKVAASGEQCCTGVGEADISAALVQDKPALSDRVV
jgi:hypothetical protein